MFFLCLSLIILGFTAVGATPLPDEGQGGNSLKAGFEGLNRRPTQEELNMHVKNLIQHFKQDDPQGLPEGLNEHIPDPFPIPNMNQEFSGTKIYFENLKVYGMKRFRLEHARSDLSALKVSGGVTIDELRILGIYSMSSWWQTARGNFSVIVANVSTEAEGKFHVQEEGYLKVEQIEMDLKFEDIKMNFENLGWFGKIFQGMVNSVGAFLFDSIKPMILQEVETNFRGTFDKEARNFPQQFPNSINPLDMAIASARKLIIERGLDPFPLPDYTSDLWSSTIELTGGSLQGLSTLHRAGSIILGFEKNIIYITVNIGAENLKGKYNWSLGLFKNMLKRKGALEFNLEYLTVAVKVRQPANLDLPPSIEELNLDIGNIAVLSDGAGTLDYIVEAMFNVLPNLFRSQIINALEGPVSKAIEEEVRKVNIESMIEENLQLL
ncbi:unnamed protein product [Allacma fusca]|uniref:Uncharacterized protein n=1 Tax=Allacma fusca TaxID=39272 RepID=A0A8J2L9R0_9HEXA|nr:unnamed protein product [Allacma fusca]